MNPGRRTTPPPESGEPHPAILALARLLARAAARDTLAELSATKTDATGQSSHDDETRGSLRPL